MIFCDSMAGVILNTVFYEKFSFHYYFKKWNLNSQRKKAMVTLSCVLLLVQFKNL